MTPWVRRLLVANVLVFVLTTLSPGSDRFLAFVPQLVVREPWTPITYMFVHAGLFHILFNMLALYFFGPRLEVRLGSGRFVVLYFTSGLVAALTSAVFAPMAAIVGASGAVFGVLVGYARYWPRDRIYIWGVLPVEARWLVIGLVAMSLWFGFSGAQAGVAHFAHLGGVLGGWVLLKWWEFRSPARRFRKQVESAAPPATSANLDRWRQIDRNGMHPVNREEFDRLFEKIAVGGVESLTGDERAFLDRFS